MADLYANYAALAAATTEGVDYRIVRQAQRVSGDRVMVMTVHGGGIEGSDTMPRYLADKYGWGSYQFNGIRTTGNAELHITSTNFDEPRCLKDLEFYERVICFHGMTATTATTYVGGLDTELQNAIINRLKAAGFDAVSAAAAPSDLLGASTSNICNKGRTGLGVQLELSNVLRDTFYVSGNTVSSRSNPSNRSAAFYNYCNALALAVQDVAADSPAPMLKSGEPADPAEMMGEMVRRFAVGDVYFKARRNPASASTSLAATSFVTYPLDQIVANVGRGSYNTSTFIYTVPKTGLYLCQGAVRMTDGTAARSLAIGIGESNADADFVLWDNIGGVTRPGKQYMRIDRFNKGAQLRMFIYSDGAVFPTQYNATNGSAGQFMSILRLSD